MGVMENPDLIPAQVRATNLPRSGADIALDLGVLSMCKPGTAGVYVESLRESIAEARASLDFIEAALPPKEED